MKLKKLEITGFKSFYERASIDFPEGITAVVGPNGCGKSNVIDAIRWVMGEQSVKQLRGKSMEDVIFSGTNGKPPLGMAEVSLTLSNDNGSAPEELKDFTEINVTRRLYRSGESAYLLNKQPCRLKDIHNIFLGSGMGSKSYSVIQQGNIGVITEAGPEERRYFVEEAAGVTRYKHHKAEALRKIEMTQQNLLRVADIIVEIKRQMDSLKRQARKAELFNKYQTRAKELDVRLGLHHIRDFTRQIDETEAMLQQLRDADLEHTAELKTLDAAVEEIKLERWQKNQAISERKTQKFDLQRVADRMEKDLEHLRSEIERLVRERTELQAARQGMEAQNQGMLAEIAQGEAEGRQLRESIAGLRTNLDRERSAQERLDAELAGMNQTLEAAKSQLLDLMARESQYRNVHQNASSNRENLKRRLKRIDEEEALSHQKIGQAQERERQARAQIEAVKAEIESLSGRITDTRQRLDEKSKALGAQVKQIQGLELERTTVRSKYATLKKMEDNFEWYKDGVRAVMQHARPAGGAAAAPGPAPRLEGIVRLVADVLEPEPAAAMAVEAALGETLQYIIVASQQAGLGAIEYLQRQNAGRSGFIPTAALHDTSAGGDARPDPSRLLLHHVSVQPGFEAIAQALLGNVVLTETIEEAVAIFNQNGKIQTLVTRNGDVVSPKGFLIGGSKDAASGILVKKQELKALQQQGRVLEQRIESTRADLKALEAEVRQLDIELQQLIERKNQARESEIEAEKSLNKVTEELKGLRRQLEIIQLEQEQLLGEASDLDDEIGKSDRALAAITTDIAAAQTAVATDSQRISDLRVQQQEASQKVVNLKLEMTTLNARLENTAGSLHLVILIYLAPANLTSQPDSCSNPLSTPLLISGIAQTSATSTLIAASPSPTENMSTPGMVRATTASASCSSRAKASSGRASWIPAVNSQAAPSASKRRSGPAGSAATGMAAKLCVSALITSKWPFAARNAIAASQPARLRQAASAGIACSAVSISSPPLALWPNHTSTASIAANTSHTHNARAAPHSASAASAKPPASENGAGSVASARPGNKAAASAAASSSRKNTGTRASSGSSRAQPAIRAKANSQAAMAASLIPATPAPSTLGSLDQAGKVDQQGAGELHQLAAHPVAQHGEHCSHDQQLGNERQSRFEYLGGGLKQAHQECGQQPREQQRDSNQQSQSEGVAGEVRHVKNSRSASRPAGASHRPRRIAAASAAAKQVAAAA